MTKYANAHRKSSHIKAGDLVYLKIRPHRQSTMPTRLHPKLAARYYGPYMVLKQVGAVAFKLQLPATARIHPVFHVSQLKLAKGDHGVEQELPEELQEPEVQVFPSKVLDSRTVERQGKQVEEVLIQWRDQTAEEATWEEAAHLQRQFPAFNLEDKVSFQGESIVRPIKTYTRRNKNK